MSEVIPKEAVLYRAWEEYEAQEQTRCKHGALPEQPCEDCAENERRYWWQLSSGAQV